MTETQIVCATLAAAVIGNMGRPVSLSDVERIFKDIEFCLVPLSNSGAYKKWEGEVSKDEPYR